MTHPKRDVVVLGSRFRPRPMGNYPTAGGEAFADGAGEPRLNENHLRGQRVTDIIFPPKPWGSDGILDVPPNNSLYMFWSSGPGRKGCPVEYLARAHEVDGERDHSDGPLRRPERIALMPGVTTRYGSLA